MATSGWPSICGRPNSSCSARFAGAFAVGEVLDAVILAAVARGNEVRVDLRVPHVIVDAVHDADEIVPAVGEDAVEAVAEDRRLDFLGVAGTDGGDHVGEGDAALEEVQVAVELHLTPVEVFPVDAGELHVPMPEAALVGDVVDREHGDE